jgi:hypothetical protein
MMASSQTVLLELKILNSIYPQTPSMAFVDALRRKCHFLLAPYFNDLGHRNMATHPCAAI